MVSVRKFTCLGSFCILSCLCAACFESAPRSPSKKSEPDHIKLVVVNNGPSDLYQVKVHVGRQHFELRNFGPGIYASCKYLPRLDEIGRSTTVVVEFEDDDEEVIRLENQKEFKIAPKGTLRLDIGENKIVAEHIDMEP